MKAAFLKWKKTYERFVEKQGFPIIVTLCVAVLTGTAVWTRRQPQVPPSPTPPVMEDVSASQLMQQLTAAQGVNENLKAKDPMQWTGRMNNCKAQAEEMILTELIYS